MINFIKSVLTPVWTITTIFFWTLCFWGLVLGILSLAFLVAWSIGPAELIAAHGRLDLSNVFATALSFALLATMLAVPFRLPLLMVEMRTYREWHLSFELQKWSELS